MMKAKSYFYSSARLLTCGVAIAGLAGCASADREGAQALATAGINATTAISQEVNQRAERVSDQAVLQSFNAAYESMQNCTSFTLAGTRNDRCDIITTAEGRSDLNDLFETLAQRIRLRAEAIDSLTAAYRALSAEAGFDARTRFETAIGQATRSATALGVAAGLGPVPEVVGTVLRIGGGQLASNAQQRRLIAASRRLQAIASHVRAALERELPLYGQVATLAGDIEANARTNLAQSGLIQPLPPLKQVVTASGFPSPGDSALQSALSRDPRLNAAASVVALSQRPPSGEPALRASIGVLDALISEHAAFEARRRLSLADLTSSIARLTEIVQAAKGEPEDPAPSTDEEGTEQ
jgi:hypothetical protein